jgi:teichuronic acid biosynthesis glycosyltransferase TuaG
MEIGLVSIVTPAFNSAALIGETIESVIRQTYSHWEMWIVIDAGTRDNTAQVVQSYAAKDPRICLLEIKDGRGISLSRNRALSSARGEFVAFLDSDDLWLPEKLEKQVQFMQETGATFSCGGYRKISQDGSRTGHLRLPPSVQTYQDLLGNNLISCPTAMFNQTQLGKFQMREHAHEDYILWLDIIKKAGRCLGIQEDLARYRVVENSRSMNVNRSGSRWKVYRHFQGLGLIPSVFYFAKYAVTALKKRASF